MPCHFFVSRLSHRAHDSQPTRLNRRVQSFALLWSLAGLSVCSSRIVAKDPRV